MPLLPPQWQVKLGEKRPERPPAQIAHLEQALPQVFPEVDPAGQRPQGPDAREASGSGRSVGVCTPHPVSSVSHPLTCEGVQCL